jgi:hypothetical protein
LVFARIECAVSSKSPFSLFFSKKTSSQSSCSLGSSEHGD